MMRNHHSLLPLVVLLATSPLVAAASFNVSCFSDGRYGANSTYEANLRRLAAILPAEASAASASASRDRHVGRAVGYWPNRLQATSIWWGRDDGDWGACIADAFRTVERACPYRRDARFIGRNCTLFLSEFRVLGSPSHIFGRNTLVELRNLAFIFQATGLLFLCFLFLQTWRGDLKGTAK